MNSARLTRRRLRILVKAYPQPSRKYGETVCCAGIDEETHELVRLYPIRYRHLPPEHRFNRFDSVEMEVERDTSDFRPESHKVREDSICVIARGSRLSSESKVRLWLPHKDASLPELEQARSVHGKSLGIVSPDPDSVEFLCRKQSDESPDDRALTASLFAQQSILEDTLAPLPQPEYAFRYRFRSGGQGYERKLTE